MLYYDTGESTVLARPLAELREGEMPCTVNDWVPGCIVLILIDVVCVFKYKN